MVRRLYWGVGSLAMSVILRPEAAQACSCLPRPLVIAPADGTPDVPLNARVWVGVPDGVERTPVVLDSEGNRVAVAVQTIADVIGRVLVLTPQERFAANSGYEAWFCEGSRCTERITGFTTGSVVDEEAPSPPVELDRRQGKGGCGYRPRWVELEASYDDILVVDLGNAATLDDAPEGKVTLATTEALFEIGKGYCYIGWPSDDTETSMRLGTFDVAGNFSGWTPRDEVSLPGCRVSGGGDSGGIWILAAAVLICGLRRPKPGLLRDSGRCTLDPV